MGFDNHRDNCLFLPCEPEIHDEWGNWTIGLNEVYNTADPLDVFAAQIISTQGTLDALRIEEGVRGGECAANPQNTAACSRLDELQDLIEDAEDDLLFYNGEGECAP